jgi:thiamine biosynthesis lipoprotein
MLNHLDRCKPLLGTFVDVSLTGNNTDNELISISNNIFAEIERIQNLMSFHDPLSELSKLNQKMLNQVNQPHLLSNDLKQVLTLAMKLSQQSSGYYDITVAAKLVLDGELPNHLLLDETSIKDTLGNSSDVALHGQHLINNAPVCFDLGGIAKGYAVDCAIKKIPENLTFTINAGGDMAISDWKQHTVALKFGKDKQALKNVIMLDSSVATSGNYYHDTRSHIINPLINDKSNQQVAHHFHGSVSVFANSTMLADALTKVIILMKPKKSISLLKYFNAKAIIINRFGFKRTINV